MLDFTTTDMVHIARNRVQRGMLGDLSSWVSKITYGDDLTRERKTEFLFAILPFTAGTWAEISVAAAMQLTREPDDALDARRDRTEFLRQTEISYARTELDRLVTERPTHLWDAGRRHDPTAPYYGVCGRALRTGPNRQFNGLSVQTFLSKDSPSASTVPRQTCPACERIARAMPQKVVLYVDLIRRLRQ